MLSILIPCRDEEESLRLFPKTLMPALEKLEESCEVIFIDDGSTDGTWQEIQRLKTSYPDIRAERCSENGGLGAALIRGFALCRGEWIAVLDADLTFSPEAIADLLAGQKRAGADMVSGSPFLCPPTPNSWRRRIPSRILNAMYGLLLERRLTSYTPMFRLYRARAIQQIQLESLGFEINAEISAKFLRAGLTIAEVPAALAMRACGRSKLAVWRELKKHARLMLRILRRKL